MPAPTASFFSVRRLSALLGVVCLVAGVLCLSIAPKKPPVPQANQAELVQRQGHWHRVVDSALFSGVMLDHYPDGQLRARSQVAQGLIEGVSEGWYTNGQRQVEEHFQAGVSHGLRTKWHPNGCRASQANIVRGQIQGSFQRWTPDGALAEEIAMKDGAPEGLSLAYYPSGFLKAEARLERGEVRQQRFWRDGEQKTSVLAHADTTIQGPPGSAPPQARTRP